MRVEILKLHQRLGNTMVYVTHDQVEAMTLADRIAVFRAGDIEQVGTPLELYPRARQRVRGGLHRLPGDELPGRAPRAGGRVLLGEVGDLRHVGAGRPGQARGCDRSTWLSTGTGPCRAGVSVFEHLGGESFVHLALDDGQTLVAKLDGEHGFAPGEPCGLSVPAAKCHVFDADDRRVAPAVRAGAAA